MAIYCRASTAEQGERYGLEAQEVRCRQWCDAHNLEVAGVYRDVVSGAKVEEDSLEVPRPELMRLLRDAPALGVRLIVVSESSRLARDDLARALLRRLILRAGLDVRSASEPSFTLRRTRPSDALVNGILGAVAEFERAMIVQRTLDGRRRKAAAGLYAGGQPPFGYTAQRGSGALAIHPVEAETVRLVFRLRDAGRSANAIAGYLNSRNYPTRTGHAWTHVQVLRILRREELYAGRVYRYAGVEGPSRIPPLLGG